MRTFPGAEMTREDMREEERDEGEDALASKLAVMRVLSFRLPRPPNTE